MYLRKYWKGSKKRMKILMLTWEYPPRIVGGIARVVNDLSKRLIKDGHEVTVVTYRDGNTPYYELDKGVNVYRVDNFMINANNFIDWIMQLNFNMIANINVKMDRFKYLFLLNLQKILVNIHQGLELKILYSLVIYHFVCTSFLQFQML